MKRGRAQMMQGQRKGRLQRQAVTHRQQMHKQASMLTMLKPKCALWDKKWQRGNKKEKTTSSADVSERLKELSTTSSLRMSKIEEINEHIKYMKRTQQLKLLTKSTHHMTDEQLTIHKMMCDEIKAKYGL